MIIKKDSEEAKLIAKLAEHSYTANVDTVVSSVFFNKHSIQFNCTKNIFNIELKIETGLDNDYVIDNKEFIEYLIGSVSNKDTEITFVGGAAKIDNISCSCSENNEDDITDSSEKIELFAFTKEQFEELEKDFEISSYCSEAQKVYDTICFAFSNGKVYEYCPSYFAKLSNIKATIDDVALEQNFGHRTEIYIIPRTLYNMFKGSDVKVYLHDSNLTFSNNLLSVNLRSEAFGTAIFLKRLRTISNNFEKSASFFKDIKKVINTFKIFEDIQEESVYLTVKNNKIDVGYGELKFSVDTSSNENVSISEYFNIIKYFANTFTQDTKYLIEDDLIVFKNNSDYYFAKFSE